MYLTKMIQECVLLFIVCWRQNPWCIRRRLSKHVCCCVQCVGGRALGVPDEDYPSMCADVYYVLGAEPLGVFDQDDPTCVRCEVCVGGRIHGVYDLDYQSVCVVVYCVLESEPLVYPIKIIQACETLHTVRWRQSPCCI